MQHHDDYDSDVHVYGLYCKTVSLQKRPATLEEASSFAKEMREYEMRAAEEDESDDDKCDKSDKDKAERNHQMVCERESEIEQVLAAYRHREIEKAQERNQKNADELINSRYIDQQKKLKDMQEAELKKQATDAARKEQEKQKKENLRQTREQEEREFMRKTQDEARSNLIPLVRLVVYACSEIDQTPMTVKDAMTLSSSTKIYKKYEKATSRWLEKIIKNTIEVVTNENKACCVKDINAGKLFLETVNSTNSGKNSCRIRAFLAAGSERWLKLCSYYGGLKSAGSVQVASVQVASVQVAAQVASAQIAVSKEQLIIEHRQNTIANLKKNIEIADASANEFYELYQIAKGKRDEARENVKATKPNFRNDGTTYCTHTVEEKEELCRIDKEWDPSLWPNFVMALRKKWEATLLYEREVVNGEVALMEIRGEFKKDHEKYVDYTGEVCFSWDTRDLPDLVPFAGKGYDILDYKRQIYTFDKIERIIKSVPETSLVAKLVEAVKFYEDSAKLGNDEAMYQLARFYELQCYAHRYQADVIPFPAAVKVMNERALYWCKRAINFGDINAMRLMVKWLEHAPHIEDPLFLEINWCKADMSFEKKRWLQTWMEEAIQPEASAHWVVDNERFSKQKIPEPSRPKPWWEEETRKPSRKSSKQEVQKKQDITERKERKREEKNKMLELTKLNAARNKLHDSREYARALQALEAQAAALSETTPTPEIVTATTTTTTTTTTTHEEQPLEETPKIATTTTEESSQPTQSSTVTLEETITDPTAAESEVMPLAVKKQQRKRKSEFKEEMLAKFSELQAENDQLKKEVKNVQDILQGIVAQLQAEKGKNV